MNATDAPAPGGLDDLGTFDRFEVIDGLPVEMPPVGVKSSVLAGRLARHLSNYGIEHGIGEAYAGMLFKLPLRVDRSRRPGVGFVPYSRWPRGRDIPDGNAWDVLPDLFVEVVSPNDWAEELLDKIGEYFQAGSRLVWVVFPRQRLVHVYDSPTQIRGLTRADTLDGGAVLPGFRLPLAELFPEPPAPTP